MKNLAILYTNEVRFNKHPFGEGKLNKTYQLFSDVGAENNTKVLLTDYRHYTRKRQAGIPIFLRPLHGRRRRLRTCQNGI